MDRTNTQTLRPWLTLSHKMPGLHGACSHFFFKATWMNYRIKNVPLNEYTWLLILTPTSPQEAQEQYNINPPHRGLPRSACGGRRLNVVCCGWHWGTTTTRLRVDEMLSLHNKENGNDTIQPERSLRNIGRKRGMSINGKRIVGIDSY